MCLSIIITDAEYQELVANPKSETIGELSRYSYAHYPLLDLAHVLKVSACMRNAELLTTDGECSSTIMTAPIAYNHTPM